MDRSGAAHLDPSAAHFGAITQSGALDHTLKCARQEAQAAAKAISSFPDSIFKESLLELCSYSTARQS